MLVLDLFCHRGLLRHALDELGVEQLIFVLVMGAPIRLESRGSHQLKGVPGSWEIFAVVS
jgi:hypothetical protein